jgi:hypothetical protein
LNLLSESTSYSPSFLLGDLATWQQAHTSLHSLLTGKRPITGLPLTWGCLGIQCVLVPGTSTTAPSTEVRRVVRTISLFGFIATAISSSSTVVRLTTKSSEPQKESWQASETRSRPRPGQHSNLEFYRYMGIASPHFTLHRGLATAWVGCRQPEESSRPTRLISIDVMFNHLMSRWG